MIRFLLPFLVLVTLMKLIIIFLFFSSLKANDREKKKKCFHRDWGAYTCDREEQLKCFDKYTSYYALQLTILQQNCIIIIRSKNESDKKRAICILENTKRATSFSDAISVQDKCSEKYR